MNPLFIGPILEIGKSLIDRVFPDKIQQSAERAKAEYELIALTQANELKGIEVQLSAIIAEANSTDPWTSRARPSFLYVVYILLLMSIPMGILSMFYPEAAATFTVGFKAWFDAIPRDIIQLFGVVMLGYIGGRSWEKVKGVAK